MRRFFTILALFLLSTTPIVSQTKSDKDRDDLVGPVKTMEAHYVDFLRKDNQVVEFDRRSHTTTYNTEGNISERTSYDQNDAIRERLVHTYDAKGRNTGYKEYSALLDKTLTYPRRHVYTLNEEGRKVEYIVFESNGSMATRFVYKYDAKGNLTEEEWYSHTGQLGGRLVSTFDEKGNQTSEASYQADGVLIWKNISKYDDNGNKTELLQYFGNTLKGKIIYTYDNKGRILEQETVEFNSTPGTFPYIPRQGKVVYSYDDAKRTKEEVSYGIDGTLQSRLVYAYDERKNEVELRLFIAPRSVENETRSTNIEYDSHGNWTRKTRVRQSDNGGEPQVYYVERRLITYY
jgi:YD repeat-containing protein